MNILFITASRIGDAVLSTGLLSYIEQKYPNAQVSVVCGPLCVSLFAGYPRLHRIIPLKKAPYHGHWFKLWRQVISTRWDMVVDLRNSAVSRLIPARQRFIFGPHIDAKAHKVEQNAQIMGLTNVPPLKLWFTTAQHQAAKDLIKPDHRKILAVAPTANWRAKTWPAENFMDVIAWLTGPGGLMEDARVAVFAAPGEEEGAYRVLNSLPHDRQINMIAKTDPGTAAAALSLCNFFIGNDSGLMHCAAAVGIPTLGLFGPSWPAIYRPWGKQAQYVQTPQNFDELIAYPGYRPQTAPCLMEGLSVEDVKTKIVQMLSA